MRKLESEVSKGSSGSNEEVLSGESVILGVLGNKVITNGLCLWSMDVVVLSSFGLLGTPSLCVL